jgi:predicted metalloprotease with PDZ domain
MKTKALASALLVAALGVAPFAAARQTPSIHLTGSNQPAPEDAPYPGALKIHVDATNIAQRIFEVHETVPVKAGSSIYLLYPAWIPGDHEPSGPIDKVAGLVIKANGKTIPWTRDKYNVYAIHVNVPADASSLDVAFQFLSAQDRDQGPIVMTPEMLDLSWNAVSLYPAGYDTDRIQTIPSVTLPAGWQFGSALEVAGRSGDTVTFKPIDYMNLVDSPIYAGKYFKRLDLTSKHSPPVHMDIVADEPKDLDVSDDALEALKNIVVQMDRLYGTFHFNHYDFLFSLSHKMSGKGLEHHRSSEDGTGPDYFTDWNLTTPRDLLTHEFNHSWDGKYRRPADLSTPNFDVPMGDSLLWVYEGQTQFWGNVIAVRAGLENKDTGFALLARVAAGYDMNRPGLRSWRNVQDTTNDPVIAQRAPLPWRNYQGSEDYYSAGQLIWLAVDGKLRQLSHDKHDLDDFARAFFGVNPGAWNIDTYTFQDVVAGLDRIVPYDWASFLRERLDGHGDLADALEAEGWKLVYRDEESKAAKAVMASLRKNYPKYAGGADFTYSVGFSGSSDGDLRDVRWDSPAFKAGLAPGMTIVAVNGTEFSPDVMKQAVKDAKGNDKPIKLLVKDFNEYRTLDVDYHGGLKYPDLERIKGTPDYLSQLYASKK